MYIYINISYICIHICTCLYMQARPISAERRLCYAIATYLHTHIYSNTYIIIYIHVCVYMWIYTCFIHVCIYMQALPISVERRPWHAISTFGRCSISTRSAVLRRLLVSWQIKTYMYMYKYLKIYVCIYIYICVCVYIYLHMCWEDFWWVKIHICV